ncbi:MFS transporter [Lactiplantibacillus modestisalitolerans]|uniref:MFS transporter n=1 Tax=Lactiplantibacillus modestisalitolerans TaxID=1457219 RepID=A0ABV5WT29_9LACO|nr:MFS transporter [Lactiplantibacillus modestisalitolerans]
MNRKMLSGSLYLNYFIHGLGLIILTQNMQALSHHWQTPLATVSYVVSGIGIGRLMAYFILGNLSDRFGRRLFVNLGMLSYLVFFLAMPFVTNIQLAYGLAILAGIANSALDSGTYTTFMEMGGNAGAANVFLKACMSAGEFLLPLLIALLDQRQWWYGWSFLIAAAILVINFVWLNRQTFPTRNQGSAQVVEQRAQLPRGRRLVASIGLAGYGYTSMALMILYTQWISLFVTRTFGFHQVLAHLLLSLYSVGSISGVLIIFILLRRGIAETKLLIGMNGGALAALLIVSYSAVSWLSMAAALAFGFCAAGGIMQVGLNLFIKLHPRIKGGVTGLYFTFGSLASFTVPLITGWLSQQSVATAMRFDLVIGLAGLMLVSLVTWALRPVKKTQTAPTLATQRQRINQIDAQIVTLLNDRFETVNAIGQLKAQTHQPVLDSKREAAVLAQVATTSRQTGHTPYLQAIFQAIMTNSRAYQVRLTRKDETND